MKKLLCILLSLCVFLPCRIMASAQSGEQDAIVLHLRSDVAGCTAEDYEKLLDIKSPQVKFSCLHHKKYPVDIDNAAGFPVYEGMTAGRTYYITYFLEAADGYALPDKLSEGDVVLECDKGVKVEVCRIADYYSSTDAPRNGTTIRALHIVAKVVAAGNIFQRIAGWFRDVYLKIRSWQLY